MLEITVWYIIVRGGTDGGAGGAIAPPLVRHGGHSPTTRSL